MEHALSKLIIEGEVFFAILYEVDKFSSNRDSWWLYLHLLRRIELGTSITSILFFWSEDDVSYKAKNFYYFNVDSKYDY